MQRARRILTTGIPAAVACLWCIAAAVAQVSGISGADTVVRARVVSPSRATLSAQIEGQVETVTKKPGQSFRKGEPLVEFDCARFEARVAAGTAVVSAARATFESTERLFTFKSVGQHDVDIARAEVRRTEAELAILRYDADQCRVNAPFDGRTTEVQVSPHESVKVGDELMTILDDRDLELEVLVPSTWLLRIERGTPFTITLDATGTAFDAEVTRIGAEVDPASQSVQVFGRFIGRADGVLSGMSGDVAFPAAKGPER